MTVRIITADALDGLAQLPESVRDRPTTSHEKVYLLTKCARYFYDAEAVREPALCPEGPHAPDKIKSPYGQGFTRAAKAGKNETINGALPERRRAHAREGFNGRWDAMEKAGQQADGRNLRDVWIIAAEPFPDAHFATMPTNLARLCILASTSEKGCCPHCAAPFVRVVESNRTRDGKPLTGSWARPGEPRRLVPTGVGHWRDCTDTRTLGWRPSCRCAGPEWPFSRCLTIEALPGRTPEERAAAKARVLPLLAEYARLPTQPATVLDPFAGSGTTGLVADRLRLDAILIELSPAYAAMARRRIEAGAPLFQPVEAAAPPAAPQSQPEQFALFGEPTP